MSATTTIRVRPETRDALAEIARRDRLPITEVVARLVDEHETRTMFDAHVAAMAGAGTPSGDHAALGDDQRALDGTLLDGLEGDPWPLDAQGDPVR